VIIEFVGLGNGTLEENGPFIDGKVWVVFFLEEPCLGGL
jgi:hypothetical protein